jgi:hypothetical protein
MCFGLEQEDAALPANNKVIDIVKRRRDIMNDQIIFPKGFKDGANLFFALGAADGSALLLDHPFGSCIGVVHDKPGENDQPRETETTDA